MEKNIKYGSHLPNETKLLTSKSLLSLISSRISSTNMSSSGQCAVGTDGKLLDASQIVWYNDAEDSVPITPATVQAAPRTSSTPKAATLHAFFKTGTTGTPAVLVAGARRSSRVSRPSKCVLEANTVEPRAESSKRARGARKKVVESDSEDKTSAPHVSDAGIDTDVEMEDSITAEDAYALTKAMRRI